MKQVIQIKTMKRITYEQPQEDAAPNLNELNNSNQNNDTNNQSAHNLSEIYEKEVKYLKTKLQQQLISFEATISENGLKYEEISNKYEISQKNEIVK